MSVLTAVWRGDSDDMPEVVDRFLTSNSTPVVVVRRVLAALVFFGITQWAFGMSLPEVIGGLSIGALYGLIGIALVLTYRTSRIINFAAGAVGAVPAITAVLWSTADKVSYLATLPIAIAGGALSGALVDILVLRRFQKTSRLIVTVVTIGIAQGFSALGFFIPIWFGERATGVPKVTTPWQNLAWDNSRGNHIITGNQVFAIGSVIVLGVLLMLFLKRSRLGIALRASSENMDRAALLGVPVNRVTTAAWAIAGVLSAMAIFSQAPLIGVPGDATLGFDTLLYGLAAAVFARMDKIGLALLVGLGIGILRAGSGLTAGNDDYSAALMLVIMLVGLLVQRRDRSRAVEQDASSWQNVAVFRPIPIELRALPEVLRMRFIGLAVLAFLAIWAPFYVSAADLPLLTLLPVYGIVGVSLVVLTGWAGQISLGQFGLVGVAAAFTGGVIAKHNIDFFAAMALGIVAGAIAAVIIGLPAIRIRGLYLAAVTLAFGYTMLNYVLNKSYWLGSHILPTGYAATIVRPNLYGKFDIEQGPGHNGGVAFYFLCLGFLILVLLAALSFRRHRSGRILIALRDNQRAATSYTVPPVRTRLSAFAISGAFSGVAGVLYVYLQHNVIPGNYDVFSSVGVFLAAAVGGLGSLAGATLGAIGFEATVLFGARAWNHLSTNINQVIPLLLTGPLLVLNLYFNPGGLAGWAFGERDKWLRRVAAKRRILVPSLVADRRADDPAMPEPELSK